ncbi:MAG: sn-glycerol-1-phosphate dehydrogenase [Atopobiaceae bacterium]|nr:sn-glycerol-1-phosphate dehydrogenase [Atopobiaceae bacterium]
MAFNLDELKGMCSCGREHGIFVKDIIVGDGVLSQLGGMLETGILSEYEHPVIVCDTNTLAAARSRIEDVLAKIPHIELDPKGLHATNECVDMLEEKLPKECDLILAVGSGTVHDLSRYVGHSRGVPFVSCPTAASVDGFVSTVAAMTWYGMKKTFPATSPIYVIADTGILAEAPHRLTASGVSDLLGKFTCIVDWRIIHELDGEYICERTCEMEMQAIDEVVAALDDIREGKPEGYEPLINALLLSGLAMQMMGNSRPASCAEHHMSHLWEMNVLNDELDALHGEKVGVGLLEVTKHYKNIVEHLRSGAYKVHPWGGVDMARIEETYGAKGLLDGVLSENVPDPMENYTPEMIESKVDKIIEIIDRDLPSVEETEALLRRGGCCVTMEDIGLTDDLVPISLEISPYVRRRLSFNRVAKMIELL